MSIETDKKVRFLQNDMAYTPLINLAKEETRNGEQPEYEGDVEIS